MGSSINLFFAMAQIMRLCADHEQINKSPFASYHQHAPVSPDTLSLSIPDKLQDKEDEYNPPKSIHGLFPSHKEAQATAEQRAKRYMPVVWAKWPVDKKILGWLTIVNIQQLPLMEGWRVWRHWISHMWVGLGSTADHSYYGSYHWLWCWARGSRSWHLT